MGGIDVGNVRLFLEREGGQVGVPGHCGTHGGGGGGACRGVMGQRVFIIHCQIFQNSSVQGKGCVLSDITLKVLEEAFGRSFEECK